MWKVTEKIKNSISSYYISTLELIEIMWNEGDSLVGVARGSVTGMYTMYLIGLIQMNPIQFANLNTHVSLSHSSCKWLHKNHQLLFSLRGYACGNVRKGYAAAR